MCVVRWEGHVPHTTRSIALCVGLMLVIHSASLAAEQAPPTDEWWKRAHAADAGVLDHALTRLARVAELYRDSALGFACQEDIAYSGTASGRLRFAYLFIRDDHGKLRDFRTWPSGAKGEEVDPRDYNVPRFLESAYLWAFVFRSDRQPLYRFELQPEETAGGRTVVVIRFIPRAPIRKGVNDWAGYARIDLETSQILSVEAYTPEDWNRRLLRDEDAAMAGKRSWDEATAIYDIERIVTDFGFDKNGMRFPSHVEIVKTRSKVVPGVAEDAVKTRTLRRVTQDYSKFEFFSVRSSDEILRFVNGDGTLPVKP